MKTILFATLTFLSFGAQAATPEMLAPICESVIMAHPTKPGFWHLYRPRLVESSGTVYATQDVRPNDKGRYAVVQVEETNPSVMTEVLRLQEPIRDLEVFEGQLWVLQSNRLLAYDLSTWQVTVDESTGPVPTVSTENAYALTAVGGLIVIAHGERGAVIYIPAAKKMYSGGTLGLQQDTGHRSMVIDVSRVSDSQVAFAVEGVTVANSAPFPDNGILLWDLKDNSRSMANYDRKGSGVLSNAVILVRDGKVLINNWGILHAVSLMSVSAGQPVNVTWTPIYFEVNGQRRPGELMGDLLASDGQVLACAQTNYQDPVTRKVLRKAVIYQGRY